MRARPARPTLSTPRHLAPMVLLFLSALFLNSCRAARPSEYRPPPRQAKELYRIEVEDPTEAALVEQQLKIKPELLSGRSFYYYGDRNVNRRLADLGYEPVPADPDDVFTRVVRVARSRTEEQLREAGITVVLRERNYWVVRATPRQLRLLSSAGYKIEALGTAEPRPRQIRVVVSTAAEVSEVGTLRVDIYGVTKAEKRFIIGGGAFDDAIDALQERGFKVEILPDPPGVVR